MGTNRGDRFRATPNQGSDKQSKEIQAKNMMVASPGWLHSGVLLANQRRPIRKSLREIAVLLLDSEHFSTVCKLGAL